MNGIPEYGTSRHEDHLSQQDERAELSRDYRAEEARREFDGWFEAQGYDYQGRFDQDEMRIAFMAGMQAQRDRGTAQEPAPEAAGARSALETAVRDRVSRNCRHPAEDCPFCGRETGEFMKLADAYAETSAEVSADELNALKSDIADLIGELSVSAKATRPSRESQVEDMVVAALTKLLEES